MTGLKNEENSFSTSTPEVLVEKLFHSFSNPQISLYIYYDQYEKYGEKNEIIFFPRFVSMEMAAIFDFRALMQ